MKLSELKAEEIRKQFTVDINGEIEHITVYNILGEDRAEMIANMNDIMGDKDVLDEDDIEEIYNLLFPICTDILIDEDIIDVINNPTKDMILVLNEVMDIVNELYLEILLSQSRQLNEIERALLAKYNLIKSEKIELLGRDCKKIENELNLIKRVKEKEEELLKKEEEKKEKQLELEEKETNEDK